MNERLAERLDKVLALADSSHEGEAVGAVRIARQLLSQDGLCFGDLARAVASPRPRFNIPINFFSGQHVNYEAQIAQLQQQILDLQTEQQSQQTQIDFWRSRAAEMEQQLNLSVSDAQRWRQLARETVEKLWEIGQKVEKEDPSQNTEENAEAVKTA